MNTPTLPLAIRNAARNTLIALVVLCVPTTLLVAGCAHQHDQQQAGKSPAPQTPTGQAFPSPDDAVRALATALRANDTPKLLAIIGPGGQDIISSGDAVADQQRGQKFLALYDQKHAITDDGPDRRTLTVGNDDWPLPVPLVRLGNAWRFDADAGKEEILNRRIGDNELSTIQVCKAIADAQREYALRDPDGDGIQVYAQKFLSDPGKHNGLFWHTAEGEDPSPLGELAADAAAEGYRRPESGGPAPYHGYYYRILQAQGPHAPDGPVDYVVNGKMTLGFAVIAWPADYGNSGIMTFIMGPDGVVYQQNLGDDTDKLAAETKSFDPGEGWTRIE
jgi:hypothetical protein